MDKFLIEAAREVDAMLPNTPRIAPTDEELEACRFKRVLPPWCYLSTQTLMVTDTMMNRVLTLEAYEYERR